MSEIIEVKRTGGIDFGREGRGLALFTGGAFFTVLLALAVGTSEPLERVTGTGVLARVWAATVGLLPGLLFCLGIAGLGAWEFLVGGVKDLKRHARGLALTALGLSILMGAFSDSAGGFLGHYSSGAIARHVHVVPAALVGLVAFLLPIWINWLKPVIFESAFAESSAVTHVAHINRPSSAPVVPEHNLRPSPGIDIGVSAAEAAALIPQEDLPSWRARPRKFVSTEMPPIPPSPYPEDMRRRGEIPPGAKPLHPPHVESPPRTQDPDEPAAPALRPRTPDPEHFAVSAREDLALPPEKTEPDPVLEMPASPASLGSRQREDAFDQLRLALEELAFQDPEPVLPVEIAPEPVAQIVPEPPAKEVEGEVEEDETISPLRPSWEQPDLFAEDEEPVDAYGTPISVVESVRAEQEDETDTEEPEVTLKPVAAARGRKKSTPKSSGNDRSQLLAEIGCHLLERGRVAVSMLQKQYGMDFEEATRVLDELQRMGLIGPYLGGQRRDILLTREEWLEKVSSL